jgi:hypothetical protein
VLYTEKLLAELERQREAFARYSARFGRQIEAYRAALGSLGTRYPTAEALEAALAPREQASGARPTAEYDRWRALQPQQTVPVLPFAPNFANHEEARAWAECLRGVTTVAVDGSQLLPWRDASLPVAIVQAGVYENPHLPPAPYLKDVEMVVLTPEELLAADDQEEQGAGDDTRASVAGQADRMVHLRRFELEAETLIARMRAHTERRASGRDSAERPIVVFCDGSLIVSFARRMSPWYRERYLRAERRLLDASQEYQAPLVGYIDTSLARDIVVMLRAMPDAQSALPPPRGVSDALLWRGALGWGDRTPAFLAARDDLPGAADAAKEQDVAFVYFQAALDRPPARVEFPRWIVDAGLLDAVMDAVRAETIVGNGYPYPIEAADAVAVITTEDRARFYRLFQEFTEREGLPFGFSRKVLSKSRRRV